MDPMLRGRVPLFCFRSGVLAAATEPGLNVMNRMNMYDDRVANDIVNASSSPGDFRGCL